ncbi:hypothetical protein GCM10011491_46870 [Brucella endophytica]|uniref:Uncharacterized protein n=1 Tax=Brucella endophytica TaxID=1963359 RepID=A0A916SR16_9HYPH|nr:hypothetical protein [Brucella endophytica]GGB13824.1 hypothetical protein GCM10011491_46870 [Brucella endophytica]
MKDDGEFSSHGNFGFAIAAAPRDAQSQLFKAENCGILVRSALAASYRLASKKVVGAL